MTLDEYEKRHKEAIAYQHKNYQSGPYDESKSARLRTEERIISIERKLDIIIAALEKESFSTHSQ